MTAKHVTVEGLPPLTRIQRRGERWQAFRFANEFDMDRGKWTDAGAGDTLTAALRAAGIALPDDCPMMAGDPALLLTKCIDQKEAADDDAAALAEALRMTALALASGLGITEAESALDVALAAHDRRVKGGE